MAQNDRGKIQTQMICINSDSNVDFRSVLQRHRVGQQALQPTESTWHTVLTGWLESSAMQNVRKNKHKKNNPNSNQFKSPLPNFKYMLFGEFLYRTCSCTLHIDVLCACMHTSASKIIMKEVGQRLIRCCVLRGTPWCCTLRLLFVLLCKCGKFAFFQIRARRNEHS